MHQYIKEQEIIKKSLVNLLRRTNGEITTEKFYSFFSQELYFSKKLKYRLLKKNSNNMLEWKLNIITETDLIRRIGINKAKVSLNVLILFKESKLIQYRSQFPHLTYSRNKKQFSSNMDFPVFGFDILLRNPVHFSQTQNKNNNFKISQHAFVYFIHADNTKFMIRANMGKNVMDSGLHQYLDKEIEYIYLEVKELFYSKEFEKLVYTMCVSCNLAIKKWTFSGV